MEVWTSEEPFPSTFFLFASKDKNLWSKDQKIIQPLLNTAEKFDIWILQ